MDELIVEALEDGRIVRVSEEYALREGLFILKQVNINRFQTQAPTLNFKEKLAIEHGKNRKSVLDFDVYRKPLNTAKDPIYTDLIENFHWEILKARKIRGLTRKQVARSLSESEDSLKLIENGILPAGNYVLLNKVEQYFKINLRKGVVDFNKPMRNVIDSSLQKNIQNEKPNEFRESTGAILGSDIEIID